MEKFNLSKKIVEARDVPIKMIGLELIDIEYVKEFIEKIEGEIYKLIQDTQGNVDHIEVINMIKRLAGDRLK